MRNVMSRNVFLKRWVFNFVLKFVIDWHWRSEDGSAFQSCCAMYEKVLSPYVLVRALHSVSDSVFEERRERPGS